MINIIRYIGVKWFLIVDYRNDYRSMYGMSFDLKTGLLKEFSFNLFFNNKAVFILFGKRCSYSYAES